MVVVGIARGPRRAVRKGGSRWWDGGQTHQGLWLLDMLMTEKELTVQIAQVDCIEINDVNLTEASEHEVFEQLTANATGSNK